MKCYTCHQYIGLTLRGKFSLIHTMITFKNQKTMAALVRVIMEYPVLYTKPSWIFLLETRYSTSVVFLTVVSLY